MKRHPSLIVTPWASGAKIENNTLLNSYAYLDEECCPLKEVGGKKYKFVQRGSEIEKENFDCSNTCFYEHAEKDQKGIFCFKQGKFKSECAESKIGRFF